MPLAQLLRNGLIVQGRVLYALMLREIHTINGNSRLGYLWVLIQSVFSIAVFWTLRVYMNAHAPQGMSMALFLAVGFGITKTMTAVAGNRALLTFPQVTELDVMISRICVITATQVLTTVIIVGVSVLFGSEFRPDGLLTGIGVLIFSPLCALGMGMILGSLAVFAPVLDKLVPMLLRIAFFVSGVFFSITAFKQDVADILLYNPVMQAIEMMRVSLHDGYVVDGLSFSYLAACTLATLVIGGFLERYVRARRKDQ